MINIEIKNIDGIYILRNELYSGNLTNPFMKRNFFLNLETVHSFNIGKIKDDLRVQLEIFDERNDWDYVETKDLIIPSNSDYIFLETLASQGDLGWLTYKIIFTKEAINEFHRIKRILTEKLIVQ